MNVVKVANLLSLNKRKINPDGPGEFGVVTRVLPCGRDTEEESQWEGLWLLKEITQGHNVAGSEGVEGTVSRGMWVASKSWEKKWIIL